MFRTKTNLFTLSSYLLALSIYLALGSQLQASVRIEKIDYKGWQDARKISNSEIELIIVPQIGRIMSFSRVGKENILWENPKEFGKVYPPTRRQWINYGGYKLWLAPQSELGWPPDPYIDRGRYAFDISDDGTILLRGQLHPSKKIRLCIEIKLAANRSELVLTHRLENHSEQTMAVSFWGVSQVNPNGQISVIPEFNKNPIWDLKLSEIKHIPVQSIYCKPDTYRISHEGIPDKKKVYIYLEKAQITYDWGCYWFTMYFDPYQSSTYPSLDSNFEVYFCPQYIELETVSPLIAVGPGQAGDYTVHWTLRTMDKVNDQLFNRKKDQ
jgi:hypothetical protein